MQLSQVNMMKEKEKNSEKLEAVASEDLVSLENACFREENELKEIIFKDITPGKI